MKLCVLGCNSFAGAHYVASALSLGHSVIGINRSLEKESIFHPYKSQDNSTHYQFLALDINKDFDAITSVLAEHKPEIVVDFAGQGMVAESWAAPGQWFQTNVVSKVRLHNFLKEKSWLRKYIRVSTPEVYGSSETLIDETAVYNPSTPYAVSHAATDMSLKTYFRQFNLPVVFTRFANFYGPAQQLYRIVPKTIICARKNQKLPLHGGGKSVRSFIYVDDVCSAINACIERAKIGETYHFSTDEFVAIKDLVQRIHGFMGLVHEDLVDVVPDRVGKDFQYLMDSHKARQQLGWRANTSLDTGLKNSVEWIQEHWSVLSSMPLTYVHKE